MTFLTSDLEAFIVKKSLTFRGGACQITSPNGRIQKWLIDLRPVLLDAKALNKICSTFWDLFEKYLPFQIGGMEVAAVPLVTALLMSADQRDLQTNGFIIRKSRKRTGLGKRIEGDLTDLPIILVDDIMNSGASLEKARKALEQEGKEVSKAFVVIDYESQKSKKWSRQHNIKVHSLMNLEPFGVELRSSKTAKQRVSHEILWRYVEPGAFPYHVVPKSTPLVATNRIFMGTDSGKMVCVDRLTGKAIWKFDVQTVHPKGIWSSPAFHDGKIYFGAYNGNAYCLEAETGKEVWKNPCCEFIGSSPLIVPEKNMIFLGLEHQRPRMMGGNAAFDLTSSSRVWERAQGKYQHGSAAYFEADDLVIFGNADHDITAYRASSGETVWRYQTGRSIKYAPTICKKHGVVVATSFDGCIYILDVRTGALKGRIKTNDICYTSALIAGDKVFAGSGDKHMYVTDLNSMELIKKIKFGARIYSSPKVINEQVVFGTSGGDIVELNPHSLEVEAKFQLPDAITNAVSASPDGDVLYASTVMNELYAIRRIEL